MFGLGGLAKKAGGWALKKALKPQIEKVETQIREVVDRNKDGDLSVADLSPLPDSEALQEIGVWIDGIGKDVFRKYGNDAEAFMFTLLRWALGQIETGAKRQ